MSAEQPSLERLSASAVQATVVRLSGLIEARFPARGLARVAVELTRLAADVSAGALAAGCAGVRPASRVGVVLVVLATLVALVLAMQDAGRVDSSSPCCTDCGRSRTSSTCTS